MTDDQAKTPNDQPEAAEDTDAADAVSEAGSTSSGSASNDSTKRVLAALFWLLASISIMASSVTFWAHQTLLTSNGWAGLVEEVVSDPEVIDEISTIVVTRISDSLGVQDTVAGFLPDALGIVAGALTTTVEDRVADAVAGFIASEGFQEAFVNVNVVAHDAAMATIRGGDSEALTSEEGLITLNIFPIIEAVLLNLQDNGIISADREIPDLSGYQASEEAVALLERVLGRDLPDDIGTITLVDSENLALVQQIVRYFDVITIALLLLALLFIGLALWLSSSRARMVLWLAGGGIGALFVGRFVARLLLNRVTDRAQEGDASVTALAIVDAAVDSLMWFLFVVIAVLAVVALMAIYYERRKTGEHAPEQTPPRTLGHWLRENSRAVLLVGLGVIAFFVLWNVGGPDVALLTAAAVVLLLVGIHVIEDRGDESEAEPDPEQT